MHLTTHTARRRHRNNMLSVAASAARTTTRGIEPFSKNTTGRKNRSSSKVVRCLKGTGTVIKVRRVFRLRNGLPFYPLSLFLEDIIIFEEIIYVSDRTLAKVSSSTLFDAKEEEEEEEDKDDEREAAVSGDRAVGTENIRSTFEGEHDPKSNDRGGTISFRVLDF